MTANVCKTELGKQSGPPDFPSLTLFKNIKTSSSDNEIGLSFSVVVKILSGNSSYSCIGSI